jgi:hypothetical protein
MQQRKALSALQDFNLLGVDRWQEFKSINSSVFFNRNQQNVDTKQLLQSQSGFRVHSAAGWAHNFHINLQ